MNERMMRWAPQSAAEFITAFSDGRAEFGDPTWLVWAYEGDYTLADLMVVSGQFVWFRLVGVILVQFPRATIPWRT